MASKQKINVGELFKKQVVNFLNSIIYSSILSYLITSMLPGFIGWMVLAQILIFPVWLGHVYFQSSHYSSYVSDRKVNRLLNHPAAQTPVLTHKLADAFRYNRYVSIDKGNNASDLADEPKLTK